ncbi:SAM-dependent methyltransferase [Mesorhizobium sp. M0814]|uniref:HsdM family class I SAM-dependent methyltransferase n=1 Tax=Mesorhizobium sp. M0814 TaxID=2957004 RepID=UPI00333DF1DC
MPNERKTENIVRDQLKKRGFYNDPNIEVEEQQSANPQIKKLLKQASKQGTGVGLPEFVIRSAKYPDLIIVIECKASPLFHRSPKLDKYSSYACDGALLYAANLSKSFDVIAIGVSGEKSAEIKINHFLHLKGQHQAVEFLGGKFLGIDDYYAAYVQSPEKFNEDYASLLKYSQELNKTLHGYKVKESQRSLLLSGILISLKNGAFTAGFSKHKNATQLASALVQTVVDEMSESDVPKDRIENLRHAFSFIKTHTLLSQDKIKFVDLIRDIDKHVNGFMKTHAYFDTIGQFYIEFLRYANNDKGLGIVLTPPHITELFVDLAEVNKNSVIWDNCCGTGGFLISAMKKMIADSEGDSEKVAQIKANQLFGIEYQDDIYALAVSNMILHGDGKSNVALGSCFDSGPTSGAVLPTVGLLNPPYTADSDDVEEIEFILNNLAALQPKGRCVAIIPISCVLASDGPGLALKERLMKDHTVEAVMSMPEDLFHNSKVGVITCTLVVTAHVPHPKNKKTWLGYWRSDGFVKLKARGRVDADGVWPGIRDSWLKAFQNREVDGVTSVMAELKPGDEWCAEAYLQTDYAAVDEAIYEQALRQYLAFQIAEGSA